MTAAEAIHASDAATLARGAGVNLLGNIGRLSRALAMLLIARHFGVDLLGLYAMSLVAVEFAGRFVVFGQDPAVVYFLSRARTAGDEDAAARVVGSSLVLVTVAGLIATSVIWFGAGFVADHFLNEPETVLALRPMAFMLMPLGILSVLLAATRANKVMKYNVLARSFVEPFALLVGVAAAASFGGGLAELALAPAIAAGITAVVSVVFYRRLFSIRSLLPAFFRPDYLRDLVRYAVPTAGRDLLAYGVGRADFFMVGHFLGMAAAGIYNMVIEVAYLIKDVRQAVEPILAPLVAEQHYLADRDRLNMTYGRATRWALLINLAYFGVAALAGNAILAIYGNAFAAGGWALAALVLGQVISGAFGLSEMMLMMIGRPGLMFGNMAMLFALIAGLDYVFIQLWGLTGAAIGTATATAFVSFVQVAQVKLSAGVHPLRASLLKPVVACGAAIAVAWFLPLWSMPWIVDQILRALVFAAGYFALLNVFGLEPEEQRVSNWVFQRLGLVAFSRAVR